MKKSKSSESISQPKVVFTCELTHISGAMPFCRSLLCRKLQSRRPALATRGIIDQARIGRQHKRRQLLVQGNEIDVVNPEIFWRSTPAIQATPDQYSVVFSSPYWRVAMLLLATEARSALVRSPVCLPVGSNRSRLIGLSASWSPVSRPMDAVVAHSLAAEVETGPV